MLVLATLLFVLAIAGCVVAIRKSYRALGVSLPDTLAWLGLAEVPVPRTRPRVRP